MNTMDGMDETEIIPLHKSVKVGEITYETLTLREPTAGQLEKASQATTQIGVAISLIALVAKVPRAVIEHLCQRDLKTISDFLGRFSEDAPRNLGDAVAELTKFYGWGPRTAWSLTVSELIWWFEQAQRMSQSKEDRA